MPSEKAHDWTLRCETHDTVWPILVHTGQQRLILRLTHSSSPHVGAPPPRLAIRLSGLIDVPWPLPQPQLEPGGKVFLLEGPANPPVTLKPERARVDSPINSALEILMEGSRVWTANVRLQPSTAIPADAEYAAAMAALVLPGSPSVTELVRRARETLQGPDRRIGFPALSSVRAAELLYRKLAHSRGPTYAWELAPWTTGLGGQLGRTPSRVYADGEATCLDMALLLGGAIEHIRRLPVLLMLQFDNGSGHLIPGVRVNDDDVEVTPVVHGLAAVKNACNAERTHLFDPNALIDGAESAVADARAREYLSQANDAYLVDVQAAREQGIWPLVFAEPLRVPPGAGRAPERAFRIEHRQDLPKELVEELASGRVVFLLGDALDTAATFSQHHLVCELARQAGLTSPDLAQACTRIERGKGREALRETVRDFFSSNRGGSRAAYEALVQLPVQTVVSFYPDPLLEEVLRAQDPPFRVLIEDGDLAALQPGQGSRQLYLLGGSAVTGEGLVLTEADHLHLKRRIEVLARGLRDRLATQTLVLLGCDLTDFTLRDLYLEATAHLTRGARPVYSAGDSAVEEWIEPLRVLDKPPHELLKSLAEVLVPAEPHTFPAPQTEADRGIRTPFKYLDYYEAEDADLFFGREEQLEQVGREILASPGRLAVLCGRSGVGKTSLVKAGLIPWLKKDGHILATYVRCGPDPEQALVRAIREQVADSPTAPGEPALLKRVLGDLFERTRKEQILFLDQAEEAFIKLSRAALDGFFHTVRDCVTDSFGASRLVLVIREDYLGRLADHCRQVPRLVETAYRLPELSREAARDAIIMPAVRCGMTVEPELVEALLDDLSPDTVLPAHLQIICYRLYEECRGQTAMTYTAYERLGRAARILQGHLEEVMGRMPRDVEPVARSVLRALVTSEKTKDLLTRDHVVDRTRLDEEMVERALRDLISVQRLVREVAGDPLRFELSHETLAPPVAAWLDEEEANARKVQEIVDQEVATARRSPGFRLPADRLHLIDDYRDDLSLSDEAVILIVATYVATGRLPEFWQRKLEELDVGSQYAALLWRPLLQSEETLEMTLTGEVAARLKVLPPSKFPAAAIEALKRTVLSGPQHLIAPVLNVAMQDSSSALPVAIMLGLEGIPSERAEEILAQLSVSASRQAQELSPELVKVATGELARRGRLPEPWRAKLAALGTDAQYEALLWRPALRSETALRGVLCGEAFSYLKTLSPRPFPENVILALAAIGLRGAPELLGPVVQFVGQDASGALAIALLAGLDEVSEARAEMIVTEWDSAAQPWPADVEVGRVYAVVGAFARRGRLPEPWRGRLAVLGPDAQYEAILWRPAQGSEEALGSVLRGETLAALQSLPPRPFPEGVATLLANQALRGAPDLISRIVELGPHDATGRLATLILEWLDRARDGQADLIVLAWESTCQPWPEKPSRDLILAVSGALARIGQLHEPWLGRLQALGTDAWYEALLWRPAASQETLRAALHGQSLSGLGALPPRPFPKEVAYALATFALHGDQELVGQVLRLVPQDASGRLGSAILPALRGTRADRAQLIVGQWETAKIPWPDGAGSELVKTVADAFVGLGRLPEPFRGWLMKLGINAQYETLLFRPARRSLESLERALRSEVFSLLNALPYYPLPGNVAARLQELVKRTKEEPIRRRAKKLLRRSIRGAKTH